MHETGLLDFLQEATDHMYRAAVSCSLEQSLIDDGAGTAYVQRVFIPVFRYVKVIQIHQDFPELWLQTYCHLFYGSQCISYFGCLEVA